MSEAMIHSGQRSRLQTEVKLRAAKLASGLSALGVGHGDKYVIVLRNEIAFIEATLAAGIIGAVPVPVNWHWTGDDLHHLLHDSGAKLAFVHSDLLENVELHMPEGMAIVEVEVPEEIRDAYHLGGVPLTGRHQTLEELVAASDPILEPNTNPPLSLIYTSGTTGLAKGIIRDPVAPERAPDLMSAVATLFKLNPAWSTLLPAPIYHSAPNTAAIFATAVGMPVYIMPKFDPEEFLRMVQDHKINTVQMVPTMFTRLLQLPREVRESYDVSSLKAIIHAAAPCPWELKLAMIEWFGPIVDEFYGGSEGGMWVHCTSEEAMAHPGTVGRPFLDADIRILGPDNLPVPTGEQGIIYGKNFSAWPDFTYVGNEQKRRDIEVDGYITVGDVGYLDEDGFLHLTDRLNDMVISGGVNIYPAEIEARISTLEGVADVAVFGIPDVDFGESLAAHVQLLPGAVLSAGDIKAHVVAGLAKYKVPRTVVFEETLPREDTGKMFKRRLKAPYWETATKV